MKAERASQTRNVECDLHINAAPEAVWKALTDSQELVRWFALNANIVPEKGGTYFLSWEGEYPWDARIDLIEPPGHLRLAMGWDSMSGDAPGEAAPSLIDIHLEAAGGGTNLRLAHSGFSMGQEWDEDFESTRNGWRSELRTLRLYVEKHLGHPRSTYFSRKPFDLSREEVWKLLTGKDGPWPLLGDVQQGERVRVDVLGGTHEARVELLDRGRAVILILEDIGDSHFRFELAKDAGRINAFTWLCSWRLPHEEFTALASTLDAQLGAVPGAEPAMTKRSVAGR